jgi:predicted secreted hydrolase
VNWKLAILWTISLLSVNTISSSAQAQRGQLQLNLLTEQPMVISGNDVGFRIERTQDGIPVGKVVVRVDGRWVDTLSAR